MWNAKIHYEDLQSEEFHNYYLFYNFDFDNLSENQPNQTKLKAYESNPNSGIYCLIKLFSYRGFAENKFFLLHHSKQTIQKGKRFLSKSKSS